MKWNRFNLLSPAGECRDQPLTDIVVEVVALDWGGGVKWGVAAPQSLLVN